MSTGGPLRLRSLTRSGPDSIALLWDDGEQGSIPLVALRDRCPCAACRGETVLFEQYVPPPPDRDTPGRYQLVRADPVGSYALKLAWGDGHDQGIYTWELLRSLSVPGGGSKADSPQHNS